ncbi:MAG: reverse transcriptase-like protein [Chloroflexi bacterium]|nr:reverse transcriptase-like protein [Chloroflexota bacterium]
MATDYNEPLKVFIDGASRGNPGHSGAGVSITDADGGEIFRLKKYLGKMTNNQAEYNALLLALEKLAELGIRNAGIYSDSELIVRQVKGQYKVKNQDLMKLLIKVRNPWGFTWKISHIPREENKAADRLANEAIDEKFAPCEKEAVKENVEPEKVKEDVQVSAGGVVYKKDGKKIKVCLVSKKEGRVWALPKGRLREGETPEQCAEREILEETGNLARVAEKIAELEYKFYWRDVNTLYHKKVHFFRMELVEENARERDKEAYLVEWFSPGQAERKLTYYNEKEVLNRARKVLEQ